MTVIQFANKCMKDADFLKGGVMKNERKYLDDIGFKYTVEDGCITESGDDLHEFYNAVYTLLRLNERYERKRGTA